jgi:subtilisin-like proprotein convertase family protein
VGSWDSLGNEGWQAAGPVYADGRLTPDYVMLEDPDGTYLGWMDHGCSLVGTDRRAARYAQGGVEPDGPQRLYASWNEEALRLAWTGADWNTDGDLMVYLDTTAGGSAVGYNAYTAAPAPDLILPPGLEADYLVWVQSEAVALMLRWTGGGWVVDGPLAPDQFRLVPGLNHGHTDLYLPLATIGLASPASQDLDLVAVAIEGPATGGVDPLEVWATMPSANPVNSGRSLASGVTLTDGLSLSFDLHWDDLAAGRCPNGSDGSSAAYLDVDLTASLASEPAGADKQLNGSPAILLGPPAAGKRPVAPGELISYTVSYHNRGQDKATGVSLEVNALHTLELVSGDTAQHKKVLLPDIEAGVRGTATFLGFANTGLSSEPWAAVEVGLHDSGHMPPGPPLARLRAHHAVDIGPPLFAGIQQPSYLVGAGVNPIQGYAFDESGVTTLTLEIEAPSGTSNLDCPDSTPGDGQWACDWNVMGSNNDLLSAKIRATDGAGWTSGWGPPRPFKLDSEPPQLTFSFSTTQELGGGQVQAGTFGLDGAVTDNGGIGWVEVCLDGTCTPADLRLIPGTNPVIYEDLPGAPRALGAATTCGGGEMEIIFEVAEAFDVGGLRVGFVAEHARRDDLVLELESPSGTLVRLLEDDGWASTQYQNYDLLLDDASGTAAGRIAGDMDTGSPYYQVSARPVEAMAAFVGQPSAGTWTLRVCDLVPGNHDGAYQRSHLTLAPLDGGAKAGAWSSQASLGGDLDHVPQILRVYGQDVVGNRTTDPISLTVWVDNVPPVVTVTGAVTEMQPGRVQTVLSGTVTDGGPVPTVEAYVQDPDGVSSRQQVQRSGDDWSLELEPTLFGRFTVWIRAVDEAGNVEITAPYTTDLPCFDGSPGAVSLWAEPAPGPGGQFLLSATISNTGETVPAGLPVAFYADEEPIGATMTSRPLGPGQAETVTIPWTLDTPGSWDVSVVLNEGDGSTEAVGLCADPASAMQRISLRDLRLDPGWNLVSSYVDPFVQEIEVVQRPIEGEYEVIESYDRGRLVYQPGGMLDADSLHTFDGEHGYWIKAAEGITPTLRIVGQVLPADHGLRLDAGWNLVSYLEEQPLPVETALASIDGWYTAVLGYEQGAQSFYPDLDPGYNTLVEMVPMHGYWIHVTAPVTLRYRQRAGDVYRVYLPLITRLAEPSTQTAPPAADPDPAPRTEMPPATRTETTPPDPAGAGMETATASWVNFYGTAFTAEGLPLPAGTHILAYDPDGSLCGAVEMETAGRYGLLPCYGDDPTTPGIDEGAQPGDLIRLYVEGDVEARATGTWTQHGDGWQVDLGPAVSGASHWVYLPVIHTRPGRTEFSSGFEAGAGSEWSKPEIDTAPKGQTFLGQFGDEEVRLSLPDLTEHSQVTVTFDLYIIRSWDGSETVVSEQVKPWVAPDAVGGIGPDIWRLEVEGGPRLLYTTFSNWDTLRYHQAYPDDYPEGHHRARTGAVENNGLGYHYTGPQDAVYHLSYTFDHTGRDLVLIFAAEGLQEIEDESWGLDNVEVNWD